jgi:hypothetical protein
MKIKKNIFNIIFGLAVLLNQKFIHAQDIPEVEKFKVMHSLRLTSGAVLKEVPREVWLIPREATQKNVGQQVALNALLFVIGGGFGVQHFSKEELTGMPIPDVEDRRYLRNPVSEEYISLLKSSLNERISKNDVHMNKIFKHPVTVEGGRASLVYEALMGESVDYYLKLDLWVSKRKESAGMLTLSPIVLVDCTGRSEKSVPLEKWAEENYKSVSLELQKMLDTCQSKVMAEVDNMFAQ